MFASQGWLQDVEIVHLSGSCSGHLANSSSSTFFEDFHEFFFVWALFWVLFWVFFWGLFCRLFSYFFLKLKTLLLWAALAPPPPRFLRTFMRAFLFERFFITFLRTFLRIVVLFFNFKPYSSGHLAPPPPRASFPARSLPYVLLSPRHLGAAKFHFFATTRKKLAKQVGICVANFWTKHIKKCSRWHWWRGGAGLQF